MGRVEYQRADVAHRYSRGRALADDVLARWRRAVIPLLPDRPRLRVLDVGAGTGIFARAWPRWRPCQVIALEPAHAMRVEMVRSGVPNDAHVVGARGERLPLREGTVDVAWLSAVVHHFADLPRCVAELRRVLAGDGVVLLRGLFADCGRPAGLQLLPGWQAALSAFPFTAEIEVTFGRHGFTCLHSATVEDAGPSTVGQAADRVRRLRHADSLLGQFSDDQIADGLAAMERADAAQDLPPTTLGLVAFGIQ